MTEVNETLGRLYLWQIALNRIIDLLAFRKRVDRFFGTGRPQEITELYDHERIRLKTSLRLEGEALDSFEDKHGSLFPDIHDIQLIDELITEEIIIKFCTILNHGNGKTGSIAPNKKLFRDPILDEIIAATFTDDSKETFNQFIEDARTYRDKRGAHFDQESFHMTHGDKRPNEDGVIYHVGWSNALETFDWDFVDMAIPMLNKTLNSYIQNLREEVESEYPEGSN